MQSRMDKYKIDSSPIKSRTQKNRSLYEEVKNSTLREFDINSNFLFSASTSPLPNS